MQAPENANFLFSRYPATQPLDFLFEATT